jgi:hypothetical protein
MNTKSHNRDRCEEGACCNPRLPGDFASCLPARFQISSRHDQAQGCRAARRDPPGNRALGSERALPHPIDRRGNSSHAFGSRRIPA